MSSFNAQTLTHAREALAAADQDRQNLAAQVREQAAKIMEFGLEIKRQMDLVNFNEQLLADARREIEALRAQLPDVETIEAFAELNRYLVAPEAERNESLRIAA